MSGLQDPPRTTAGEAGTPQPPHTPQLGGVFRSQGPAPCQHSGSVWVAWGSPLGTGDSKPSQQLVWGKKNGLSWCV